MSVLSRTPRGRQSGFETRMAMQRELDTTRTQLQATEDASGDLRRQALSSREDAAAYRAENLRLADELRNCKNRLNACLDAQDDVLRKNSDKHAQIHELQNREAALRDELTSKTGLATYYQEQNAQLEAELSAAQNRCTSVEQQLNEELTETLNALEQCKNEVISRGADNEALRAQVAALREELAQRDTLLRQKDAELSAGSDERREVQNELQTSIRRLEAVQDAQEELRSQIAEKTRLIENKHDEIERLTITVREEREQSDRLQAEVERLELEADKVASLQRTQGHLADELEQRERHIRTLEQEKARLAVEADDAHALRMSTNRLADQLAERDEVNHRLEAEASRLALEKADLRAAGEAHARAVETELAVSRAKERAFVGARHLHHVGGTRAEIEASRALRSYHAVRSQRLAPADHVSYVRHHRHVSRFY